MTRPADIGAILAALPDWFYVVKGICLVLAIPIGIAIALWSLHREGKL